jgi:hypothetical protein
MKIKNAVICQNCGAENEYYKETCKSCKAYLRARIFNLDLWMVIWRIIESPMKAFKEIIFSEHKNYVIFLLILMGGKYFINSLVISNFIYYKDSINETSFTQVFPVIAIFSVFIFLFAYISTKLMNALGYRNIVKSVSALLSFAFVPSILIFAILTPIEFALFGKHWFYHNPSPVTMKQNAAYILFTLEGIIYLWCCVLCIKAFIALTGSRIIAYIFGIVFVIILTAGMFLIPLIY